MDCQPSHPARRIIFCPSAVSRALRHARFVVASAGGAERVQRVRLFHNAPRDTFVFRVSPTSFIDVLRHDVFQLELSGAASSKFRMTTDNVIRVDEYPQLQGDIGESLAVIVTARSLRQSHARTTIVGSLDLLVDISTRNVHPPEFIHLGDFEVHRSSRAGTALGSVHVTDKDADEYNQVSVFWILSASAAQSMPITIDPERGILRLTRSIVRDQASVYRFTIVATNTGSPSLESSQTVQLHIRSISGETFAFNHLVSNFVCRQWPCTFHGRLTTSYILGVCIHVCIYYCVRFLAIHRGSKSVH